MAPSLSAGNGVLSARGPDAQGAAGLAVGMPSKDVVVERCTVAQARERARASAHARRSTRCATPALPQLFMPERAFHHLRSAALARICRRKATPLLRARAQGHAISIGSEISGGVYNITFRDILMDGRASGGYGAGSIRVKSARGRGGVVDGVLFEVRGPWVSLFRNNPFFAERTPLLPLGAPETLRHRSASELDASDCKQRRQ